MMNNFVAAVLKELPTAIDIKETQIKELKEVNDIKQDGLTESEKKKIASETSWSPEIIENIKSMDEYKIYADAGLEEVEVNGKPCLIKSDIDLEQKDTMGRTNKERMEAGLAPLDADGKAIELHHIGQKADSPLAELSVDEHRGRGNDGVLHDKNCESEIDRNKFNTEKANHWKSRAEGE